MRGIRTKEVVVKSLIMEHSRGFEICSLGRMSDVYSRCTRSERTAKRVDDTRFVGVIRGKTRDIVVSSTAIQRIRLP